MEPVRFGIILGAAFLLAACSTAPTPTPYQHVSNYMGGYSEVKLSADTYRISVQANGYTSETRAYNIALLRASDLTLANGFDRFEIVGGRGIRERYRGRQAGASLHKPSGEIEIRMVAKNDPNYADALDAQLIATQLRPRLEQR
jgi:hypothetical protein